MQVLQLRYLTFCILCTEFNRGDVKDAEMNAMIDAVVECLFSVFITLGKQFCRINNSRSTIVLKLQQALFLLFVALDTMQRKSSLRLAFRKD